MLSSDDWDEGASKNDDIFQGVDDDESEIIEPHKTISLAQHGTAPRTNVRNSPGF